MAGTETPAPFLQLSPRPILLGGPTAVGKTEIALRLAEKVGGEIVSVDSMQVYRGLDIGTAKPGVEERRRVPHHLIDVVDVNEPFDVAQFVQLAREAIADIQKRVRVPILSGGTGLYFKALLEGIGQAPGANLSLRAELEKLPLETLLKELEKADPETFARIDRKNPRRVIRAVEVIRLSGKAFAPQKAAWAKAEYPFFFGLTREVSDLRKRIDARVDKMFEAGLIEETRRALKQGLEQNRIAMQALGYRQVVEHLRGERSLPDTIAMVKLRTRQYAKRQFTWFRRQALLKWIDVKPDLEAIQIVDKIAAVYLRKS